MRDLPLIITTGLCLSACGALDEQAHPFAKASRTEISATLADAADHNAADASRAEVSALALTSLASSAPRIDLDNGRLAPGNADLRLMQEAVVRTYRAHLPPSIAKGVSTPLVIVLGPSTEADARAIQMSFDGLADSSQFAAVYPEIRTAAAREEQGLARGNEVKEDVNFIRDVIADVGRRIPLDSDRVFVFSHGSKVTLAQSLICEMPELFSGLVTLSNSTELAACALEGDHKQLSSTNELDVMFTAARAWEFFESKTR